jgi:hypothetical protein
MTLLHTCTLTRTHPLEVWKHTTYHVSGKCVEFQSGHGGSYGKATCVPCIVRIHHVPRVWKKTPRAIPCGNIMTPQVPMKYPLENVRSYFAWVRKYCWTHSWVKSHPQSAPEYRNNRCNTSEFTLWLATLSYIYIDVQTLLKQSPRTFTPWKK